MSAETRPLVGEAVEIVRPYTSPTGVWFPAGTEFLVVRVGESSTMLRSMQGGAVVWMDTSTRQLAGP